MKVLHLVTRDYRRGAEVDAVHIARLLADAGLGGTVRALAPPPPGHPRLGAEPLGPSPLHPATLAALRREARRHDVVVAHGSRTLPAARLALLGTGQRFVYRTIGTPSAWAGTTARRLRVRWMLAGVSAVAALGEGSRRDVIALYRLPPERVVVVGSAHDAQRFVPASTGERAAARASLSLRPATPVVAVLSALSPEKRLADAIAAVSAVPDAVLLLAGDGPERRALEAAVPAEAAGRVRFLGHVEDVVPVLHAADVGLLTSSTEGVPGALVQAGLCGLPVVATRVGYVDDVVVDGVTGRLVDVGDVPALARGVVEAVAGAPAWGPAARRHCLERYDSARARDRWVALLSSHRVAGSNVPAS